MLRTAVHCLLALLLCLNGFLAPLAMASHTQAAMSTQQTPPCHGDMPPDGDGSATAQADPTTTHDADCCKPGHCACAQAAAATPAPLDCFRFAAADRLAPAALSARRDAPLAVALRPPIG